ncbi:MAG TPA: hypothetical protein PLF01_02860, partial [Alphaproteobacteria bacterium]|nr:hypothetical protein [Alphaproteobacteria bacterium]
MRFDILNNRKHLLIAAGGVVALLLLTMLMMGGSVKNAARPDQQLTIPAMGNLPPLHTAMENNAAIRERVNKVLSVDEAYLFVNYREINGLIAEILFLWSGLTVDQLQTMKGRQAIDYFLRYIYDLPDDEPLVNNPILGDNPWPNLFNRFKTRLLMQGNGYKIYSGTAYYNSADDEMVIEGGFSKSFMTGFTKFLKKQNAA